MDAHFFFTINAVDDMEQLAAIRSELACEAANQELGWVARKQIFEQIRLVTRRMIDLKAFR